MKGAPGNVPHLNEVKARRYSRHGRDIQSLVRSQLPCTQTINLSVYTPLSHGPNGISIGTKAASGKERRDMQFAIWTAAWHFQMTEVLARAGKLSDGPRLIALLPLLVVEHDWTLSFVCDSGDGRYVAGRFASVTRSLCTECMGCLLFCRR